MFLSELLGTLGDGLIYSFQSFLGVKKHHVLERNYRVLLEML